MSIDGGVGITFTIMVKNFDNLTQRDANTYAPGVKLTFKYRLSLSYLASIVLWSSLQWLKWTQLAVRSVRGEVSNTSCPELSSRCVTMELAAVTVLLYPHTTTARCLTIAVSSSHHNTAWPVACVDLNEQYAVQPLSWNLNVKGLGLTIAATINETGWKRTKLSACGVLPLRVPESNKLHRNF